MIPFWFGITCIRILERAKPTDGKAFVPSVCFLSTSVPYVSRYVKRSSCVSVAGFVPVADVLGVEVAIARLFSDEQFFIAVNQFLFLQFPAVLLINLFAPLQENIPFLRILIHFQNGVCQILGIPRMEEKHGFAVKIIRHTSGAGTITGLFMERYSKIRVGRLSSVKGVVRLGMIPTSAGQSCCDILHADKAIISYAGLNTQFIHNTEKWFDIIPFTVYMKFGCGIRFLRSAIASSAVPSP